jgi:hypothetical protein
VILVGVPQVLERPKPGVPEYSVMAVRAPPRISPIREVPAAARAGQEPTAGRPPIARTGTRPAGSVSARLLRQNSVPSELALPKNENACPTAIATDRS